MIVSYESFAPPRIPGPGFHGVLLAGTAAGDSEPNQEMERFLRAAEPPAHNKWDAYEDRLREEYQPRHRANAIRSLKDGVERALSDLNPIDPREDEEIPEFLRRLMPFGGTGKRDPVPRGRLSDVKIEFEDGKCEFAGTFARMSAAGKGWSLRVQLWIYQEGRVEEVVEIEEITFSSTDYEQDGPVEQAVVTIPKGIREVPFEGRSVRLDVPELDRIGLVLGAEVVRKSRVHS